MEEFLRTSLLLGDENLEKLKKSKVAVFGIGGVGCFVVEGLVRSGIENIILIDNDIVARSNINRQIEALNSTVGQFKVDVMKRRILDINPNAKVTVYKEFYEEGNENIILDESISYIVDAIDTVKSKIDLVKLANRLNIPIISCMSTGNKMDPTKFEISDIYKTSVCPLCKVMRKQLKQIGIKKLKVVYSKEEPKIQKEVFEDGKRVNSSIAFVPSVAGMIIASEVVKDLIN